MMQESSLPHRYVKQRKDGSHDHGPCAECDRLQTRIAALEGALRDVLFVRLPLT
tara:strand:- start:140 stop:301 length:162 start_codon:yes stop_codon:yes gene_type:complete